MIRRLLCRLLGHRFGLWLPLGSVGIASIFKARTCWRCGHVEHKGGASGIDRTTYNFWRNQ